MTDKDKLALIYRIVSGYTIIGDYIIDTPGDSLINESLGVRAQVLFKYRFENLLLEDFTEEVLIRKKLWTPVDSINLKELDKALDDCKFELYNSYGMPTSHVKKIRNRLEIIKKKKITQLNTRHSLDRFTLEGLADSAAEMYVFSKIVLDLNYKPVTVSPSKLQYLIRKYKESWPSNEQMRLIARTEPWRSFWSTNPSCFRTLGDEQKVLVLFSKMYDNVYEHSDRPVDGIINDDDLLDGWFIHMKKKNEEAKKESAKASINQKHPNAGEIFLMASSEEDVKEIESLNDARARIIKGKINEQMKHKDIVRDKDIPELRIGS